MPNALRDKKIKTSRSPQFRISVAPALLCAVLSLAAIAQTAPETTGDPRRHAPTLKQPKPAPIERAKKKSAATPAGGSSITVTHFVFTGNTVYTAEQLRPLVAPFLNHPIKLLDVYAAADRVTEFYVSNGYTLASATVPAQKISGGGVRLEIIEGRIAVMNVEGTHWYSPEQVAANLGTFKSGEIYRGESLETGLRNLNHLPGLQAKALLQPGEAYGTSKLLIVATEHPLTAGLTGDNYGRKNLGEYRGTLNVAVNNPLRIADQLQLMAMHTEAGLLEYFYGGYNLPLWHQGPRFSASYGEARFHLNGALTGVNGESKVARGGLDLPLVDRRNDQLSVGLGGTYSRANADLTGTLIGQSELTLYDVSAALSHTYHSLGVSQAVLTLQSSLRTCSTNPCQEQRLRAELDLQHLQPLIGRLDAYVHGNYVYSPDPLPDFTKASLGGPTSVRAYQAAELRGDRGLFGSVGLREGLPLGTTAILHGRIFADSGEIETLQPATATSRQSLSSAGAGLDFDWSAIGINLNAKADWSYALGNYYKSSAASEADRQRIFAAVTVSYQ